jgi:hypothetical protein
MTYVNREKLKATKRKTKTHQNIIINPLPCKEYNYGHLQLGRQPCLGFYNIKVKQSKEKLGLTSVNPVHNAPR